MRSKSWEVREVFATPTRRHQKVRLGDASLKGFKDAPVFSCQVFATRTFLNVFCSADVLSRSVCAVFTHRTRLHGSSGKVNDRGLYGRTAASSGIVVKVILAPDLDFLILIRPVDLKTQRPRWRRKP